MKHITLPVYNIFFSKPQTMELRRPCGPPPSPLPFSDHDNPPLPVPFKQTRHGIDPRVKEGVHLEFIADFVTKIEAHIVRRQLL